MSGTLNFNFKVIFILYCDGNKNPYLTMEPPVPGAFYKRIYKKIKCLYETQGVEITSFFFIILFIFQLFNI